jgi:drug/metabolite transporter (DMT)-like permease
MSENTPSRRLGWLCAAAGVAVAAAWQLSTRKAALGQLAPFDLLILRYSVAALVLLPWLFKHGFWPRQLPVAKTLVMLTSGGLGFGLLAIHALKLAPVAHFGALVPGTVPIFVAALCWWLFDERIQGKSIIALAVLMLGVMLVSTGGVWNSTGSEWVWLGDLMFVGAAAMWAVYSVNGRSAGLEPLHLSGLVAFWSTPVIAIIWLLAPGSLLPQASWTLIVHQGLMQGVLGGVIGTVLFLTSLKHLGTTDAASAGAATPAVVAVGGWLLLGEGLNPVAVFGVGLTVVGILAAQRWK